MQAIAPDALESWLRDSIVKDVNPFSSHFQRYFDSEASTFNEVALKMAERAFAIDRGRPARTYGELLGGYLKTLPDGLEPQDLLVPESK